MAMDGMATMEGASGESGKEGTGMEQMGATGVVYMTIVNAGSAADRLVGVRSDVAQTEEMHRTVMEGEVVKMQPVVGGVEVPASGRVEFKPGGYHIMLIGLKRDLRVGDRFNVELLFEKSGTIRVESVVQ
jgi:copper(I)-binding protein